MRGPESTNCRHHIRQHVPGVTTRPHGLNYHWVTPLSDLGPEWSWLAKVESHDPFPLAVDAECHQLYTPPGSTAGGLLLLNCSGELILSLSRQYVDEWQQAHS